MSKCQNDDIHFGLNAFPQSVYDIRKFLVFFHEFFEEGIVLKVSFLSVPLWIEATICLVTDRGHLLLSLLL